jgi:hypothetical protein
VPPDDVIGFVSGAAGRPDYNDHQHQQVGNKYGYKHKLSVSGWSKVNKKVNIDHLMLISEH